MSGYDYVPPLEDSGAPIWWAMVKTPHGPVPVRVTSWFICESGSVPRISALLGVDTSPSNVIELKQMSRDEGWRLYAEWNRKRDRAVMRELGAG
ncbi:hypothetical protein ABZT23_27985 [Streptomyces sp. NPDC005386]|uniref:hypothetical protein n=1 Tax=Streptomyces sp. NPDC005386 TaxID=3154562 RepID=UPI0033AE8F29